MMGRKLFKKKLISWRKDVDDNDDKEKGSVQEEVMYLEKTECNDVDVSNRCLEKTNIQ